MQPKRQRLDVSSPPRDIPKARPLLRVPSPPPVPLPSEREEAKRKKAKRGGTAGAATAAPAGSPSAAGSDGFVNLYGQDVSSIHCLVPASGYEKQSQCVVMHCLPLPTHCRSGPEL